MRAAALLVCVALSACGTFPLGTSYPLQGQTRAQTDQSIAECQLRAHEEANSPSRVAGSFVAGATLVGAPVAVAEERRKQREVFAQCMTERGYRVVPPT